MYLRPSFRSRILPSRSPLSLLLRIFFALCLPHLSGSWANATAPATPLHQISATVYQTEHCLYIIDAGIPWNSSSAAYAAIYTASGGTWPNLSNYFTTLTTQFPATYFSICYMANTGASNVPNYVDNIYKASGINMPSTSGAGAPQSFSTVDFCRYNLQGTVFTPVIAVYDHELGHAWGARAFYTLTPPSLSDGHWLYNSTVDCQLSASYTTDNWVNINKIYGDPTSGFHWQKVDNLRSNEWETFSEQQLYLMGVSARFPTSYVLNSPVYNVDRTMSYSSVDTFDHTAMVATYGTRNPDYSTSPKRFKLGFVYIARDLAEVNSVYPYVEQSIDNFCNGDTIDPHNYRFQTPFVADTKFRASVDGLLSDLDGNASPTLSVTNTYVTSSDGSATVNFVASDSDGPTPTVVVDPSSNRCSVSGSSVVLSGLPNGVFFYTLKATDSGGKKTYGHFVVEVQRPAGPTITTQPVLQVVTAGNNATFTVAASGSPTSYQWYRQAARTSNWDTLSNGGAYSGCTSAALTITATTATMNEDHFLCLVTNVSGSATSNGAELRVDETAPVITTQPTDMSAPSGQSTPFSVVVSTSTTFGYFYYQWQIQSGGSGSWVDLTNGGAYSGCTTASFRVVASLAMNGDKFRCIITNTAGSTTSNSVTLSTGSGPSITAQPTPVSVSAGQTASLSVTATGTAPLTYQWSLYGVPVSGATSATLSISNAQAANAGAYTVRITNAFGVANSNVGSLTVSSAAPSISAQPSSATPTAGQTVILSVTASGTNPLSYQWRKGGSPIGGATAATLSFNSIAVSDTGSYDVVISNSVGSVTSSAATLTVSAATVAPSFTTHPANVTATVGTPVTLTAAANGSPAPTYQWKKNAVNISGATSASLSFGSVAVSDAGSYTVVATNSAGSATSNAATLTVNVPAVAPSITAQPNASSVTAGNAASFSVTATGTAPLTYQWSKDGSVIGGATSSTFSLGAAQMSDAGNYTVLVTNTAGSVMSNAASLSVTAAPVAPSISAHPQSTTVTTGNSIQFTVVATGTAPLAYQWKKNGVSLPGATSTLYSIGSAALSDAADYTVVVSNTAGNATSNVATLTVTAAATPPVISTQPQGATVTAGNTVTFTVVSTGSAPLSYQWSKNGSPISGATNPSLILAGVQTSSAADYTVVVSNSAGSATSNAATLVVNAALVAPSIDTAPQSTSVTAGNGVSFSVAASGSAPLAYQWNKDGVAISGATSSSYAIAAAQASDAASYTVVVTNTMGSATSTAAVLTVSAASSAPIITVQPQSRSVAPGGNVTLSVTATGSSPLTYQWYAGSSPVSGANQATYSISNASASDAADYSVVVTNSLGSATSTSATVSLVSASSAGRFVNLSVRGLAGTGAQTLIVGFITAGNGPLPVLVRGWGPTLGQAPFNVPAVLADPIVRVFQNSSQVAENDNWGGDSQLIAVAAQVGAYALPLTSKDAAVYTTFTGGVANTVHILGANTGTGVALAEVFDATGVYTDTSPHFINLSARGQVGTGGDVLIAGFVIGGQSPVTLLIRGLGPTLSSFGVTGVMTDPKLELFSGSTLIDSNDNWSQSASATQIAVLSAQLGIPLPANSKDAAILATLQPGLYSAILSGVNSTTGVGLIDLNQVP